MEREEKHSGGGLCIQTSQGVPFFRALGSRSHRLQPSSCWQAPAFLASGQCCVDACWTFTSEAEERHMLTSRASPAYHAQHHASHHPPWTQQKSEPAHPAPGLHLPLQSRSFLGLAVNDSFSAVNIHKQQFPLPGKTPLAF